MDSLAFLSLDGVRRIAENCHLDFCDGCFTGEYPVEPPKVVLQDKYARKLADK